MRLLILVTVFALGQPAIVRAETVTDACRAKIHPSAAQALAVRFPDYRLPLVADSLDEDVRFNREHGGTGCLLVASGDFDGDGVEDVAVGLIPQEGKAPVVAVALARKDTWLISTLRSWADSPMRLYLGAVPPGVHRRTEALDPPLEPAERQSLRCTHEGVIVGATESTGIVYCYIDKHWLYVWVSS